MVKCAPITIFLENAAFSKKLSNMKNIPDLICDNKNKLYSFLVSNDSLSELHTIRKPQRNLD